MSFKEFIVDKAVAIWYSLHEEQIEYLCYLVSFLMIHWHVLKNMHLVKLWCTPTNHDLFSWICKLSVGAYDFGIQTKIFYFFLKSKMAVMP